jgi:hypothetical protein
LEWRRGIVINALACAIFVRTNDIAQGDLECFQGVIGDALACAVFGRVNGVGQTDLG